MEDIRGLMRVVEDERIGRKLLKYFLSRRGIELAAIRRELGNAAKEIDVPPDELMAFVGRLMAELLTETFE